VFDLAADVAACIKAVREDSDAHVVRIKNKLDPAFDASPYGGYRDVAVNLRLTTPAAVRLGLESHVCELQLLLRPFAEFKVGPLHSPTATTLFIMIDNPFSPISRASIRCSTAQQIYTQ
jgi:hypothetical protein